jgi:hypothetical protein
VSPGGSLQKESRGPRATHERADVPEASAAAVGVAVRLEGSRQLTKARHRMKTPWIAPGCIGEEAQGEARKPNGDGR